MTTPDKGLGASIVDSLCGLHIPLDGEPAYVIRSSYLGRVRYFYTRSERAGVITVARHHAQRFKSRDAALAALEECRNSGSPAEFCLVGLRPRVRS